MTNEFSHIPIGTIVEYEGRKMKVHGHWAIKEHPNGFRERIPCLMLVYFADELKTIEVYDLSCVREC